MKRVTSLRRKSRIAVVHEGDDTIITTPRDALSSPTTFDIRCKTTGKLLFRQNEQGLSFKCNWCHEVQIITMEQLRQMRSQLDQMPKEASDNFNTYILSKLHTEGPRQVDAIHT